MSFPSIADHPIELTEAKAGEMNEVILQLLNAHENGLLPTELLKAPALERFQRYLIRDQLERMVERGDLIIKEWRLKAA